MERVTRGASGIDELLNGLGNERAYKWCSIGEWRLPVEVYDYDAEIVDIVVLSEKSTPE
jgi:hypothetical protein